MDQSFLASPRKRIDFLVFVCLIVFSALIWWYSDLKALYGFLLFNLLPSVYLFLREKKNYLKIGLTVLVLGFFMGFIFDVIQVVNNAWVVDLVLPWKILGIEPWDNLIGYALMVLMIVVFYEHFLDSERKKKLSKKFLYFALGLSALLIVFLAILLNNPSWFKIPYSYTTLSLGAIVTPIVLAARRPSLIPKMLISAFVFFGIWFLNEITALKTGGWLFPGQYIGLVDVFGVSFPLEEIIFWMLWYAATMIAFYELFLDDCK